MDEMAVPSSCMMEICVSEEGKLSSAKINDVRIILKVSMYSIERIMKGRI